ncbi:sensor histidine kinase [Nocardiopsis trehalosi]|jgi:signal transduction histidine kinase|uniref:sensor histidine kinase n=1 Tax=Nocardiopsis trehalosi TaxID=109329 RepID=UPI00082AEF9D|nr:ATP-binding protein [Nocardiopsis trehalosi]
MADLDELERLAGRRLAAAVPDVLAAYRARLAEAGNPLGTDPALWPDAREQAVLVLDDTCRELRGDADAAAGPAGRRPAAPLGDLLGAAGELTAVALEALGRLTAGLPGGQRHPLFVRAALVLTRCSARRTRALAESHDTQVARRVEQATAAEYGKLAVEIHDRIGGSLALAFRHLEMHRREGLDGRGDGRRVTAIEESLEEAAAYTRHLVSGLSSTFPRPDGLHASIQKCAHALNPHRIPVVIEFSGQEDLLPGRHRDELFLVVREFLRNAFTHASPTLISIRITITERRVSARLTDNGTGFDAASAASAATGGLRAMRERAERLGGGCRLKSAPGSGTRMWLWAPLPDAPDPGPDPSGVAALAE